MANDPEALTQLSRLIGGSIASSATAAEVQAVLEQRLALLADGLLAEAIASDDVFDRESGLEFIAARLDELAKWMSQSQRSRLLEATRVTIESW